MADPGRPRLRARTQAVPRLIRSWDEAHSLAGRGRAALADGHPAEAGSDLRQAHEIFRRINSAEADQLATELEALRQQHE